MMKQIFTTISGVAFAAMMALHVHDASAQQPFGFACRDYISTDDNRAPQSAFSYDDEANTFTIRGNVGNQNIAFQMDKSKDNAYVIPNDRVWMAVTGTNLSTDATKSRLWWWNGQNRNSQYVPALTTVRADGKTVLLWNLKNDFGWSNVFDSPVVNISARGAQFIMAMGLTAATGTSATLTDISYNNVYEVAMKWPEMIGQLGYTAESMTAELKTAVQAAVEEARQLKPVEGSELKTFMEEAENMLQTVDSEDYATVYLYYDKLPRLIEDYRHECPSYSYVRTDNGILATWNDEYIRLTFHADDIVRICKSKSETVDKRSLSVVLPSMERTDFTVEEAEGVLTLNGARLCVTYDLAKAAFTIRRTDGTVLLAEQDYAATFTPAKDGSFDSYKVKNSFTLDADEYIFGMGQIQDGALNLRGRTYQLEQDNMKVCIPFFQSSKNYSLFWDNYSPTTFADGEEGTSFTSTGNEIDYYVMAGDTSDEVLACMRRLTGHSPMPALWNFGLYQSKQRYTSADEVMDVVKQYRELGVPLDCIVQDWQYWGDDAHWNALAYLNPTFANHQEMIDMIHANNAKYMISIWANFGPATEPYAELNGKGLLLTANSYPWNNGIRPYDCYSEEGRDIYWKYLYNGLISKGLDAYWMDSTEPDYRPLTGDADFDCVSHEGRTWRSLRNAFPLATVGGVHDHHRAAEALGDTHLAGKRVSIMTRSAFAGQQRYGANTWSGDVTASWENFARQIPAACNFSVTGIPYWNSDTGAFFVGGYRGGVTNADWRRLYMRWTQFSCFCPMMRFHGDGTPREIYQFGQAGDGIGDFDHILKYVKLRYRLLPYLYSTAWQVTTADRTFMQALPVAFNADRQGYDVCDEYMFGQSFLVAPVVKDLADSRDVYLPADQRWIDFWTGETMEGGQTVNKKAAMDIIPLYVKAGTILPWGPDVQYSNERNWDNLEIRVYPGQDGTFVLYEDENDNYNYEKGRYSEIPFVWDEDKHTLTIGERKGAFDGMLDVRTFNICLVSTHRGIGDGHESRFNAMVTYNGEEVKVVLDETDTPVELHDITQEYIVNPSFEQNGTEGWIVETTTSWSGVNMGGGNGDPEATDGSHIFGVWDSSNSKSAVIYQNITLPQGQYKLTVDMQASNRNLSVSRVGDQRLFAGDNTAFFKDQVMSPGCGDTYPMQTLNLDFSISDCTSPFSIGVATDNAPSETWFKIDNFRLYSVLNHSDVPDHVGQLIAERQEKSPSAIYDLAGMRHDEGQLKKGIYIGNGRKFVVR
ncbi:MAG: DUF5110 domain-containing protein [Clostridium sp.]|nr:DUF5110 domain-containing protein [Clostridium sp.]